MKKVIALLILLFASAAFCGEYTFKSSLPSVKLTNSLTSDMFKHSDAVIILKSQSYSEGPHSRFDGFTIYLTNEVTSTSKVIIAKVFNDAGVREYGSFEYEYQHFGERELRETFVVHARIMKPDSTVWVMPDSAVSTIVGAATGSGKTLTQKALFKLNNLAPGDVVQIEYIHTKPFSFMRQVIFYYHDRYPVLSSNLTVNMDKRIKVDLLSFPADKIGPPNDTVINSMVSHFWSVKGLGEIPREPYSRPFSDVSYMTAIIDHPDESDGNGWRSLSKHYIDAYIDKGSIPKSFMKEIGLDPSLKNPTWADIDKAYTALRKYFTLERRNRLFPRVDNVDNLIEDKEANASDLAYLMMKILERWEVPATPLLVRDIREGLYEISVSSYVWFDRLAPLVSLHGESRVYDFDRSIPTRYTPPWFLNETHVLALHDTGVAHLKLTSSSSLREHISKEFHSITLSADKDPMDFVSLRLKGARAARLREKLYSLKGEDLVNAERNLVGSYVLRDIDTTTINDFLDESEISITGKGTSQGVVTSVDSFVTFRPRNHLLREFRDHFSADERYDYIFLDEPFGVTLQWTVEAPEGYRLSQAPSPGALVDSAFAESQIMYLQPNDSTYYIKTDVIFNSSRIIPDKYKDFIGFLDKLIQATERELIFKKR